MTQTAAVRGVALVAMAVIAIACGRGDRGSSARAADSAGRSTGARASGPTSRSVAAASIPGALARPIDQYSGDELLALVRGLRFGGGVERARRCRDDAACDGPRPGLTTRVRVDAVQDEDSLSAAALPANGVVAARALNQGRLADAMYGMRPAGAGVYEYFLIVLPGPRGGASATWRLEELALDGPTHTHRVVKTGVWRECNHAFQRGARADFKTCETAALDHASLVRPASFAPSPLPQTGGSEPPIWIGCALGCCTSDM